MIEIVKVSKLPKKLPWVEGVDYTVVAGTAIDGDIVRVRPSPGVTDGERFSQHFTPPTPAPRGPPGLSKTSFMDAAISGIKTANTSTQGAAEARFQEIIEAAKNFAGTTETSKRVRYIHERYAGAGTFNKNVVTGMLAFFKAAGVATLTSGEEAAILAAWPEA